jgi:nicotinamide riboside transporter PnuC
MSQFGHCKWLQGTVPLQPASDREGSTRVPASQAKGWMFICVFMINLVLPVEARHLERT